MVARIEVDQATRDKLTKMVEEFEEELRILHRTHPHPSQELDEFLLRTFDPEVFLPLGSDPWGEDPDDDELNGW